MIIHKGETLFRQGESGPLYRIKSGLFKIVRLHEDGSMFLFNIIVPGEMIPHHSLISPMNYHGTAIALISGEVEIVHAAEWYDQLNRDPARYHEVAALLQDKLRMMQQRIDQLTRVTPADKLEQLQHWFATYLKDIPITEIITQDEIGQLIGLRRETVNRLLRAQTKKQDSSIS
ncbi:MULTISPECIES: Crp/Fnr family transcriptional regulator [Paenibacillus]|uniref:Crp/Fnr family transcriptional regulator n=1 Tax=Paenibacillus TaxID=44249 RepID=UPI00038047D8|nr:MULTISPECIES: Crp/Fnr family transcriptional regulator [Paenibacillus]